MPFSFQSYFVTYERFVQWLDWLQDQNNTRCGNSIKNIFWLFLSIPTFPSLFRWSNRKGTVGAVAVDASGNVAAATSTGGTLGKLPGRVGDTPGVSE